MERNTRTDQPTIYEESLDPEQKHGTNGGRPEGPSQQSGRSELEERTLLEGLLYYIGIVWRYKWLVIVVTAVAAIGIVGFSILSLVLPPEASPLPNHYEASAMLLQQRGTNQNVSANIMASLGLETTSGPLDYGQIAIEVLNSRSFVDTIVNVNDIADRYEILEKVKTSSREAVLNRSSFGYDSRTGILTIAYEDIDPEFAAQVVDSMTNELLGWFAARGGSDRLLAVETMEAKLVEVERQIASLESRIEEFQRTYGVLRVE